MHLINQNNLTTVMDGILRGYGGGGGELRGVRVVVYHNSCHPKHNRAKLYQETSYFDTNSRKWQNCTTKIIKVLRMCFGLG